MRAAPLNLEQPDRVICGGESSLDDFPACGNRATFDETEITEGDGAFGLQGACASRGEAGPAREREAATQIDDELERRMGR